MIKVAVDEARLLHYAPEMLAECQSVLDWLEIMGYDRTHAAIRIRQVIRHLEEAGVEPYKADDDSTAGGENPDYKLDTIEVDD
ncbi:MAG TPA: hypothetical protein VH186_08165 [Chloroflexia bacterium]|nr:hypothetical protein [Chloroflexia bacterium]